MSRFRLLLASLALSAIAAAPAAAVPVLYGMGDLPGGSFSSDAFAVSNDGSTVVGRSRGAGSAASPGGYEGARWRNGELTGVGVPPPAVRTYAWGVSGDGNVVVGRAVGVYADQQPRSEAYRWTEETGLERLGFLPSDGLRFRDRESTAGAASADGSVIVGASITTLGRSEPGEEAFRWENGVMRSLGLLPGGSWSASNAVSADGSVVVGRAETASGVTQAFRWTARAGMVGLGGLPGSGGASAAADVSADGATIAGTSLAPNPDEGGTVSRAFVWTAERGMKQLCGFCFESRAFAVTDDGSTIVGTNDYDNWIWHDDFRGEKLEDYLEDLGLDFGGWKLRQVQDISGDGQVIVGQGTNPQGFTEGWIVLLPEPSTALLLAMGLSWLGWQGRAGGR